MVCSEVLTAEGYATGYFRPGKTIRDFVYAAGSLHTDRELFDLLYSNINTVVTHLTESESLLEFPPVRPARGWYSFRNGVYDCASDVFFPYDSRTRPPVCTVHYVDQPFTALQGVGLARHPHPQHHPHPRDPGAQAGRRRLGLGAARARALRRQAAGPGGRWCRSSRAWPTAARARSSTASSATSSTRPAPSSSSNNLEQQFGLQDALGPASPFMVCCGSGDRQGLPPGPEAVPADV